MKAPLARLLPYVLAFFSSMCIMVLELVASRLVVPHVGMSLPVWTAVIGVILAGICLGNVLGGRLADQAEPRRVIGPLYLLGAALVISILWINAGMSYVPALRAVPLDFRVILVVTLDFLIPATVLGMISPVVAKIAVEEAKKSGSALGDVYMLGAIGSIVGTFFAGFYLIYLAPSSTIVAVVAAALAFLGAILSKNAIGLISGLIATICLAAGVYLELRGSPALPEFPLGWLRLNAVTLAGHALLVVSGIIALAQLLRERGAPTIAESKPPEPEIAPAKPTKAKATKNPTPKPRPALPTGLRDLALLSFVSSVAFMAFEMVAGRLVTRHLGSSVYGWTSVIGVLLAGLSIGNYLGGKLADRVKGPAAASWLFLASSILVGFVLLTEATGGLPGTLARNLIRDPIRSVMLGRPIESDSDDRDAFLSMAIGMNEHPPIFGVGPIKYDWGFRVFFWTAIVFLPAAIAMGTVSPLVAKLAVDRMRAANRPTGAAIGQVYAWGMVGSILGTFLTGFLLIDVIGTRGVLILLLVATAIAATALGGVVHAIWAGVPVGLCVIALFPTLVPPGIKGLDAARQFMLDRGLEWGLRERTNATEDPDGSIVYADESNYYYIKVSSREDVKTQTPKRTLVLDNLIHGYFIIDHPERLDYDYEHIYALVARRAAAAKAARTGVAKIEDVPMQTLFLGGGSYTFPRYLQSQYSHVDAQVAEIDPAVTKANIAALALPKDTPIKTAFGDARQFVAQNQDRKFDLVFGDAFNDFSVPWHLTTRDFNDRLNQMLTDDGIYMINIIDVYDSDEHATATGLYSGGELAFVKEALRKAGVPTEEAALKAGRILRELDDAALGVDLGAIAERAAMAIEKAPYGAPAAELEQAIKSRLDTDPLLIRGDVAAMIARGNDALTGRTRERMLGFVDQLLRTLQTTPRARLDQEQLDAVIKVVSDARAAGLAEVEPRARRDAILKRFSDARNSTTLIEESKEFLQDLSDELREEFTSMIGESERDSLICKTVADAEVDFNQRHDLQAAAAAAAIQRARDFGGFLSSWVETARLTFPNLYVFGTSERPGRGQRETFVVVASKRPLDLTDLGGREGDPKFGQSEAEPFQPRPYDESHMKALSIRSRGIHLTDDYAPVENLLAPVAATRGND